MHFSRSTLCLLPERKQGGMAQSKIASLRLKGCVTSVNTKFHNVIISKKQSGHQKKKRKERKK